MTVAEVLIFISMDSSASCKTCLKQAILAQDKHARYACTIILADPLYLVFDSPSLPILSLLDNEDNASHDDTEPPVIEESAATEEPPVMEV